MKYYVLKHQDNYADEFDVDSIWLLTEAEYNEFIQELTDAKKDTKEIYFGTNEYIETTAAEVLENTIVTEIDEYVYSVLMDILGYTFSPISIDQIIDSFYKEEKEKKRINE